ncbi:arsenate reductase/protein-tyrosine-phosphatase family protein [Frondihabitans sp. 762G35]|uniref:arsenate reductase/protein-tyrosine-phosphatase family protein n=1 Tax=Frondihabitans sp. 762G35 TaxID=1446794 RepID=UPI001C200B60|nr:low molecular weight phosphatase family protein [Frondihabitans sp. 762G35]
MCTGNICRSPLAEFALRQRLEEPETVVVKSRGTHAISGTVPPRLAIESGAHLGIDLSAHRAEPLTESDITDADLVLALSAEHRAAVARLAPKAVRKTLSLVEFGHLSEAVSDDDYSELALLTANPTTRLREVVALVMSKRGTLTPSVGNDDVVDPYGHGAATYRASADQIMPAVDAVARCISRVLSLR